MSSLTLGQGLTGKSHPIFASTPIVPSFLLPCSLDFIHFSGSNLWSLPHYCFCFFKMRLLISPRAPASFPQEIAPIQAARVFMGFTSWAFLLSGTSFLPTCCPVLENNCLISFFSSFGVVCSEWASLYTTSYSVTTRIQFLKHVFIEHIIYNVCHWYTGCCLNIWVKYIYFILSFFVPWRNLLLFIYLFCFLKDFWYRMNCLVKW